MKLRKTNHVKGFKIKKIRIKNKLEKLTKKNEIKN